MLKLASVAMTTVGLGLSGQTFMVGITVPEPTTREIWAGDDDMRFRASISNLLTFTRLVNSLERLGKAAWLRLTPHSVHFIIIPDSQGTQVWSNLKIEVLFESDYVCMSAADNTINLEIPLDTLHRALRSCSSTADTSLRLTKRNNMAYLALASSSSGKGITANVVTHHIPARVLSAQFVSTLKEPVLPPEDVHILLPSSSDTLRTVSERYKSLNDKLFVMANMMGELKLRVEAEEVKVDTRWTGLINPPLDPDAVSVDGHPSARRPRDAFSSIKIDAKDWTNLLRVSVVAKSICEGHALVLYVYIADDAEGDGPVLTYYIPAHE